MFLAHYLSDWRGFVIVAFEYPMYLVQLENRFAKVTAGFNCTLSAQKVWSIQRLSDLLHTNIDGKVNLSRAWKTLDLFEIWVSHHKILLIRTRTTSTLLRFEIHEKFRRTIHLVTCKILALRWPLRELRPIQSTARRAPRPISTCRVVSFTLLKIMTGRRPSGNNCIFANVLSMF